MNSGKTWGQLAQISAEKIMTIGGRFAAPGNQTIDNLAHLKADIPVGEWRDSNFGMYNIRFFLAARFVHNALRTT